MKSKDASDVARRCLCLELLLQRLGLEIDEDDTKEALDEVRKSWLARTIELEIDGVLVAEERAYLERPVGTLGEDDLDDIHGRTLGALILLWALGRIAERPTYAAIADAATVVSENGILGDGSISGAKATVGSAALRPIGDLRAAIAAYSQAKGKVTEDDSPEEIVANLGFHYLSWVVDREMKYEDGGRTLLAI